MGSGSIQSAQLHQLFISSHTAAIHHALRTTQCRFFLEHHLLEKTESTQVAQKTWKIRPGLLSKPKWVFRNLTLKPQYSKCSFTTSCYILQKDITIHKALQAMWCNFCLRKCCLITTWEAVPQEKNRDLALVFLSHPPLLRSEKMTFQRKKMLEIRTKIGKDGCGSFSRLSCSVLWEK